MSQETVNILLVVTGLIAAIGAVVAACAAWKSASTANTVHRRGIIKELLNSANLSVNEMDQTETLIEEMRRGIRDLERVGGSPDKRSLDQAVKRHEELLSLYQEATNLVGEQVELQKYHDDDLLRDLVKMDQFLSQTRQIRDSLEKQVSEIKEDVRLLARQFSA